MIEKLKLILLNNKLTYGKDLYKFHLDYMKDVNPGKPGNQIYEHIEHNMRLKYGKDFYEAHITMGALCQMIAKNPIDMMELFTTSNDVVLLFKEAHKILKKGLDTNDIKVAFKL